MSMKRPGAATKRVGLIGSVALLALLGACNDKNKAPTGQVVATVDGEDITVHELNGELQQLRVPPDAPKKQVEQFALQRVVERKMLADVARKRGLDKNPQFLLAQRRVDEGLLVQALQSDIAKAVPRTTREAAQKFIEQNPQLFAERKIYTLDQIQFLRPANLASLPLAPAKTLGDVATVLTNAKIEFRRANVQYDALTVNPQLTGEIGKILARNPDEVFVFADQPQGAPAPVMYANHVVGSRTEPFIGEKAIAFAQQVLQRLEVQKALQTSLKKFTDDAKANIKYAAGYSAPPPPPKPGATPAPAATGSAPTTAAPAAPPPT
ncbi:hypothetical protein KX816_10240 [Sphingosinicellaceae bacterium]|nr:hypothetical protein KX816_10240 [Sphingosinicellaceae bacterium]